MWEEVNHVNVVKELTHALLTFSRLKAQTNVSTYRHAELITATHRQGSAAGSLLCCGA